MAALRFGKQSSVGDLRNHTLAGHVADGRLSLRESVFGR